MKKILLVLALVLSQLPALASAGRRALPFNDGWSFYKVSAPGEVAEVTLPHCYNGVDGTRPDYYRGEAVYTKTFDAPATAKGERVFVRFEAVGFQATVKVNGVELGHHKGGFTAFCYELTDLLRPEGNVMEVTVDNRKDMTLAPINADFTMFGGIYRPVSLLVLPKVNITPLDYASPGVYFEQLEADEKSARAAVKVLVDGYTDKELAGMNLYVSLGRGGAATFSQSAHIIEHNGFKAFVDTLEVSQPSLWNGREAPALYNLSVSILNEEGTIQDRVEYGAQNEALLDVVGVIL